MRGYRYWKHAAANKSVYQAWRNMIYRCTDPEHRNWDCYGARGVTVCAEWMDNFDLFFEHIGPRPSPRHSIDRVNNNRGYEPGNVRWATRVIQANNRRPHKQHMCSNCGLPGSKRFCPDHGFRKNSLTQVSL